MTTAVPADIALLWEFMTPEERLEISAPFMTPQEIREIEALHANDGFIPFDDYIRQSWEVVEPGRPFIPSWHIDAIAEHLEAVTRGWIRNLIINIPPRYGKSLLACVLWPTWTWTFWPQMRWLFASYSYSFSKRDATKSRRLIQSAWYQQRWGHVYRLSRDQNEKTRYENDKTGYRVSTSVGGVGVGEGGDVRVTDDPHKPGEVHSDVQREGVISWWSETWSTRVVDPKTAAEVIIMQRLHERDLTGHIKEEVGGYELLMLPARYEPSRRCMTSIGWQDPRQKEGELLNPKRFGEEETAKTERLLGSYGASGQLQQRPSPSGGNIIKKRWWRFWQPAGAKLPPVRLRMEDGSFLECPLVELPPKFDEQIQSWDMAFKDTAASAYVSGQVWGRYGANKYLLDQDRNRMDLPASLAAVEAMTSAWPKATAKLVEDRANGPAVIQTLRNKITGLIPVQPMGDKISRAHAAAPEVESGNVYLPHPHVHPWVNDFIEELAAFPNGAYKDQVDSFTQAMARFAGGKKKVRTFGSGR